MGDWVRCGSLALPAIHKAKPRPCACHRSRHRYRPRIEAVTDAGRCGLSDVARARTRGACLPTVSVGSLRKVLGSKEVSTLVCVRASGGPGGGGSTGKSAKAHLCRPIFETTPFKRVLVYKRPTALQFRLILGFMFKVLGMEVVVWVVCAVPGIAPK